ncbi:MAG: PQQ-dependent sugar dehydrogenase [Acidobacteriota bacterium]
MNSRLGGLILLSIAAGIGTLLLLLRVERQSLFAAPAAIIWPNISLHPLTGTFAQPVYVTHAGDNSGRLFIVERAGTIRIMKNGALLPTPFLDITSRVQSGYIEQGLLSVAFPPGYAGKGYFYVDYTNKTGVGNTIVARYFVTANPDVADPNSEQVILNITQPEVNHNGGQLQFGPDGYLYIGMGDGGGGGDQHGTIGNAQDPSTLLGKLLRINVEPSHSSGPVPPGATLMTFLPFVSKVAGLFTYNIPATNPYITTAGYRGEIWALGLRNPWRFSFDRQTGDLYIADVGQDSYEEVDFQPASSPGGENYGWRILEGNHCYNPPTGCIAPARYSGPVVEYPHGVNDSIGCSVTGGYVYRGPGNAAMQGFYFYGDYCSGRIWGLRFDGTNWQTQQVAQPAINISTFGESQAGNLYVADLASGTIYEITSP